MKRNVFDEIDDLRASYEAKLKDLETKLEECEAEQHDREKEAAGALESGSADEYAAAKAKAREAADRVEFYEKRLDDLRKSNYFEERDKERLIRELRAYVEKFTATYRKQTNEALREAKEATQKERELLIRSDNYIKEIQGGSAYTNEIFFSGGRLRTIEGELGKTQPNL